VRLLNPVSDVKLALIYKQTAGEGVSRRELTDQLERSGHHVLRALDVDADLSRLLSPDVDLVVAAGGDGTIAVAAKALAHSGVPLAVLPRGTANNIARSVGAQGAIPELIESWPHAEPWRCDLGVIRGPQGHSLFVEGVGAGLIAEGIFAALQRSGPAHPDASAQVVEDLRHYRDALTVLKPRRFDLTADGLDLSGDYLLVEILNMPCVGPNIVLASGVSPFDGFLSVVIAKEEHRDALLNYFEQRVTGQEARAALPFTHARSIELRGASVVHVDDEVQQLKPATSAVFGIEPAAVQILGSLHGRHGELS
jgi:diacylglycerol kinase (ATP)